MNIIGGKIARYFGLRFLSAVVMVFAGIFVLVALLDYIELMRRATDVPNVSAILVAKTSLYRVPQVTERILPFCILIGAMSCYLNFSRRPAEAASIVVSSKLWRELKDAGWTAAGLSGKRLRAYGVLGGRNGLLLEVTSRAALELID